MADRPILFSGPMVRALLDGRKTQTRRILKPQPSAECAGFEKVFAEPPYFEARDATGRPLNAFPDAPGCVTPYPRIRFAKGDRLWVRETWRSASAFDKATGTGADIRFRAEAVADHLPFTWKPGIHMPRWASRLTLTVTDVRVQRLQEISEADAKAEGVTLEKIAPHAHTDPHAHRWAFRALWNAINGDVAWTLNDWVVAVSFIIQRRNIDAGDAQ